MYSLPFPSSERLLLFQAQLLLSNALLAFYQATQKLSRWLLKNIKSKQTRIIPIAFIKSPYRLVTVPKPAATANVYIMKDVRSPGVIRSTNCNPQILFLYRLSLITHRTTERIRLLRLQRR